MMFLADVFISINILIFVFDICFAYFLVGRSLAGFRRSVRWAWAGRRQPSGRAAAAVVALACRRRGVCVCGSGQDRERVCMAGRRPAPAMMGGSGVRAAEGEWRHCAGAAHAGVLELHLMG